MIDGGLVSGTEGDEHGRFWLPGKELQPHSCAIVPPEQ